MKIKTKTVSILLSVAMILATVFAVVSFTFSWFYKETHADITTIEMTAKNALGIQLSGNGTDWKSILRTDSESSDIDIDESLIIDSISTAGTVVDGQLQLFEAQMVDNKFNTILLTSETVYYAFDFYILNNENINKELVLGYNSSVIDSNNKEVALSTRVAFINLGHSTNITEATALDGTGISSVDYIWEPNSTARSKKISLYHSGYIAEGKTSYNGVNMATTGLTLDHNLVVDFAGTSEHEVASVTTFDPIQAGDVNEITLLAPSAITKIRVYIWCEGQDIDCNNSISGGTATINFNFDSFDLQEVGEEYVAFEKFIAPTITNDSGANYIWSATATNISETTYSTDYLFKISKLISSTLTPVRTVKLTSNSLDIDSLLDLAEGEYYVTVKVCSDGMCDSDYSNSLTFNVLTVPTNEVIASSVLSWSATTNAATYTIKAVDDLTESVYTLTTSSLSLDLTTALFDGSTYLTLGKEYSISIKANGNLGYSRSAYTTKIEWLYE